MRSSCIGIMIGSFVCVRCCCFHFFRVLSCKNFFLVGLAGFLSRHHTLKHCIHVLVRSTGSLNLFQLNQVDHWNQINNCAWFSQKKINYKTQPCTTNRKWSIAKVIEHGLTVQFQPFWPKMVAREKCFIGTLQPNKRNSVQTPER